MPETYYSLQDVQWRESLNKRMSHAFAGRELISICNRVHLQRTWRSVQFADALREHKLCHQCLRRVANVHG